VKFVLVRHGETEWSASGQHTGRTDLALTEHGREQAARVKPVVLAALGDLEVASLCCSPLRRAQQTAHLIVGSEHVEIDDRLREFDYGDYEGLTTTEIQSMVPGWTLWDGCPGGESMADVVARVDSFIGDARARACALTAVFAHGHLLRIFAARALGQPGTLGRHLALDTASVSEIEDLRDGPAITRWNETFNGYS
jgi:probable phosphoglycerate mutase